MKTNLMLTVISFLVIIVTASSAVHSQPPDSSGSHQVWFCPNIGSADMLDLFNSPEQWASARERIDVFKFYGWQLLTVNENWLVNQNTLTNFVAADAFSKVAAWNLEMAAEGAVISRWIIVNDTIACMSRAEWIGNNVQNNSTVINMVESNGGVLRYIALDEVLVRTHPGAGGPCPHNNLDEIADDVSSILSQLKTLHPSVLVGDIEPYPTITFATLKAFILALEVRGTPLPFFHLDVGVGFLNDYEAAGMPIDFAGDMQELSAFLDSNGITFGIIFTDATWDNLIGFDSTGTLLFKPSYSESEYYSNTVALINRVIATGVDAGQWIFQSWRESWTNVPGQFVRQMPNNLPIDSPFSHTRALMDGLDILDPPPISCCVTAGDYDHDGSFNIADVTFGIARIFSGGGRPECDDEADFNSDNSFNIADVTAGIGFIFDAAGLAPPPACDATET